MRDNKFWKLYHSMGTVCLIVFVCIVNWLVSEVRISWLLTLGGLITFTMVVSDGITGRFWLGWLVNEQYRMSLSRLQMFVWTVVILSCFITAVKINIKAGCGLDALSVAIQEQLWIAMGISTASLVGSPLILSGKKRKSRYANLSDTTKEEEIDERIAKRMRAVLAEQPQNAAGKTERSKDTKDFIDSHVEGVVCRNEKPQDACLSNLFTGEEIANFDVVDITRLQAFFFTVILVLTYAINAVGYLALAKQVSELPALGASGLSLLAISTGIYLTGKAVPKGS
jgi:hypothetical protein